jgi:VanZ family protein
MTFTRRRKFVLAALLLYWPAIFLLTHVPQLPNWVITTQLGDKTPHFLVYLGLVFLWWFAMWPYKRVNWLRAGAWVTIGVMAIYGTLDEWLQGFVHRTPDPWDFAADMAGVTTGLLLLTLFDFWMAALVLGTGVLFATVNVLQMDVVQIMPTTSIIFFLFAYAAICVCWLNHLTVGLKLHPESARWLPMALFAPLAAIATIHGYAALAGNHNHASPIIAGLAAVTAVVGTVWVSSLLQRKPA